MTGHLSDEDLHRMKEFAKTPKYKRKPEHLVPEEGD